MCSNDCYSGGQEYTAKNLKIPLSNLRLWDKQSERICKQAGIVEASKVMGVKQRRMAAKVKRAFQAEAPDMKPLLAFMTQDTCVCVCVSAGSHDFSGGYITAEFLSHITENALFVSKEEFIISFKLILHE